MSKQHKLSLKEESAEEITKKPFHRESLLLRKTVCSSPDLLLSPDQSPAANREEAVSVSKACREALTIEKGAN